LATTLAIESFADINPRERAELGADYTADSTVLKVRSSEGYTDGQSIYVGQLSAGGCVKAVVASVVDATTINRAQPLSLPHTRYEPVQAVLGNLIHVYRAANINGQRPAREAFTVLATREINADYQSTYYYDSAGESNFWYAFTHYHATANDETDLNASVAVRGDDFGHCASITEIRVEAGFVKAFNLKDSTIDQQRRGAETEINAGLSGAYTVPFNLVPEIIRTLTTQLASALLGAGIRRDFKR
jgi:hypothetical protein